MFKAIIAAVLVVCIWSGWITLSRMGVQTALTPYDITLLRFGTAALLTLPFSLAYNWKHVKWGQVLIVALGCGFPYTMLSFIGLKTIKAANAGVLVNGMLPVIGLFFTLFWFKEHVSKIKYAAIFILLIANLIMMNQSNGFSSEAMLGIASLLSAAIVFSTYMAATKRWGYGMKDVIAFVPLINAVLFLPIWLLFPSQILNTPWQDVVLQMTYQGVLVSIAALLLITYSVSKLGSGTMSVFLSYVPAVTAVLAFVFLNERLSVQELIGIALCSAGLTLYTKG
ncbi:DMT family transporter [Cytophaga hutchinsonii]|uniref:Integral membrane protein n=1 Tax=Cytophaga hutchinsonii (strain ATCC 33406 / DSM 1761 / CIP 103989 / NBRC 15051 / NCIMB 9469 / D465) TaxID=269798 RepID=A0A6N4SP15_CYTH3|nr:DMT family transporter [Cytophaga hutchinsonii]ABG58063.1 integral membrane protein [Cytophaga hutchinsonii ATCC 33406]SFX12667.1 Permease of the drug/metabolite transporter (DMT) superfamily [Cytophaga hutchinsonii ATCC 33406]